MKVVHPENKTEITSFSELSLGETFLVDDRLFLKIYVPTTAQMAGVDLESAEVFSAASLDREDCHVVEATVTYKL